jgi:nucleoid-associated protein YgaU
MGLNVKLALLTCVLVTGGVCWLVNLVSQSTVELPSPLVADADGGRGASPAGSSVRNGQGTAARRDGFARRSTVESAATPGLRPPADGAGTDADRERSAGEVVQLPPIRPPWAGGGEVATTAREAGLPTLAALTYDDPAESEIVSQPAGEEALTPRGDEVAAGSARADPAGRGSWPDSPAEATTTSQSPPRPATAQAQPGKAGDESQAVRGTTHKVRKGETLASIARRTWNSDAPAYIKLLIDANPAVKQRGGTLWTDEKIVIPVVDAASAASPDAAAAAPARRGENRGVEPATPAGAETRSVAAADPKKRGGSTAKPQSRTAAPSAAKVASAAPTKRSAPRETAESRNASLTARTPKPGGKEVASASQRAKAGDAKAPPPKWHLVKKGESLKDIARRYLNDERRWREIAELNRLPDGNRVMAGSRIRLPKGAAVLARAST